MDIQDSTVKQAAKLLFQKEKKIFDGNQLDEKNNSLVETILQKIKSQINRLFLKNQSNIDATYNQIASEIRQVYEALKRSNHETAHYLKQEFKRSTRFYQVALEMAANFASPGIPTFFIVLFYAIRQIALLSTRAAYELRLRKYTKYKDKEMLNGLKEREEEVLRNIKEFVAMSPVLTQNEIPIFEQLFYQWITKDRETVEKLIANSVLAEQYIIARKEEFLDYKFRSKNEIKVNIAQFIESAKNFYNKIGDVKAKTFLEGLQRRHEAYFNAITEYNSSSHSLSKNERYALEKMQDYLYKIINREYENKEQKQKNKEPNNKINGKATVPILTEDIKNIVSEQLTIFDLFYGKGFFDKILNSVNKQAEEIKAQGNKEVAEMISPKILQIENFTDLNEENLNMYEISYVNEKDGIHLFKDIIENGQDLYQQEINELKNQIENQNKRIQEPNIGKGQKKERDENQKAEEKMYYEPFSFDL